MKHIHNDLEAIKLIQFLYEGGPDTEEEWSNFMIALENYQSGLVDIIMKSKTLVDPKEALRRAREKNKPILL
jgi:hypothetical protein